MNCKDRYISTTKEFDYGALLINYLITPSSRDQAVFEDSIPKS